MTDWFRSSVGQSNGLLSRGSWVRIPPESQNKWPLYAAILVLSPRDDHEQSENRGSSGISGDLKMKISIVYFPLLS